MVITKKYFFVLVVLLFMLSACTTDSEETITIGFMTDLTGPVAFVGEEIRKGAELAIAEINDSRLRVYFEDTQCSGREATNAMNTFIHIRDIRYTGGSLCSSEALAAAPLAQQHSVLHIATGASTPELSHAGEHIFRVWPSDAREAQLIAEYAVTELSLSTFAVLSVNTEFGVPLASTFSQAIAENGAELLGKEMISAEQNTMRTELLRLQQHNPEAIYVIVNPSQIVTVLRQIRELELDVTVLAYGPSIQAAGVKESAGKLLDGVYYATPHLQERASFVEQFSIKYGQEPGLGASVGYDTLVLLYNAAALCGADISCAREYLLGLDGFPGASQVIRFDTFGDVQTPAQIVRVDRGESLVVFE